VQTAPLPGQRAQRLLSDVAGAPLHQIEGIHACAARPPVEQRAEVGLAGSARRHELAVDEQELTGNARTAIAGNRRVKSPPFLL
jgi:hypothetical protein